TSGGDRRDGERELREGPPLGGPSKLSADVSSTWRRPRGLRQGCTYPGQGHPVSQEIPPS
ncbi:MAG: hypothetical protein WC314_21235, partial [Vulcanimicrobiota bacterium]